MFFNGFRLKKSQVPRFSEHRAKRAEPSVETKIILNDINA